MSLLSLSLSLVRRSEEKRARAFLFLKLNFKKGLTKESEKYAKERDLRKTRVLIRETTTGNNTVITTRRGMNKRNNGDFTNFVKFGKCVFSDGDGICIFFSLSLCLSSLRVDFF